MADKGRLTASYLSELRVFRPYRTFEIFEANERGRGYMQESPENLHAVVHQTIPSDFATCLIPCFMAAYLLARSTGLAIFYKFQVCFFD